MRKRLIRTAGISFLIVIFMLLSAYMGLARYYKGGFSYGTWINGIYCTGKTVDEVNQELLADCTHDGLTVYDKDGNFYEITAEDISFAFDFEEALHTYLDKQNPYLWIDNIFASKEQELIPVISYSKEKLTDIFGNIPFLAEERTQEKNVFIIKTYQGYELVNERTGILNREKACSVIEKALVDFEKEVYLEEEACYQDLPMTDAMNRVLSDWEKLNAFQDCQIIYKFGDEQVPVNKAVVCNWILLDENGDFIWDEEGNLQVDDAQMDEFIENLADEFDTVGGTRRFKSTKGETVTVEGGIYGNKMDRKAEKEYLKDAFRRKIKEIHVPEYTQRAWVQGRDDIGSTYIEIDMTEQKMYYYKNGRKELETSIVTGNTGRRMGTPSGVNYVYGKQENRILRGPNYASHVNFWMPVKGNIGIHDAAWRSEYGGEIYKTNGSHGCINTPYDAMSELYGMVEIGTPVVMFY